MFLREIHALILHCIIFKNLTNLILKNGFLNEFCISSEGPETLTCTFLLQ